MQLILRQILIMFICLSFSLQLFSQHLPVPYNPNSAIAGQILTGGTAEDIISYRMNIPDNKSRGVDFDISLNKSLETDTASNVAMKAIANGLNKMRMAGIDKDVEIRINIVKPNNYNNPEEGYQEIFKDSFTLKKSYLKEGEFSENRERLNYYLPNTLGIWGWATARFVLSGGVPALSVFLYYQNAEMASAVGLTVGAASASINLMSKVYDLLLKYGLLELVSLGVRKTGEKLNSSALQNETFHNTLMKIDGLRGGSPMKFGVFLIYYPMEIYFSILQDSVFSTFGAESFFTSEILKIAFMTSLTQGMLEAAASSYTSKKMTLAKNYKEIRKAQNSFNAWLTGASFISVSSMMTYLFGESIQSPTLQLVAQSMIAIQAMVALMLKYDLLKTDSPEFIRFVEKINDPKNNNNAFTRAMKKSWKIIFMNLDDHNRSRAGFKTKLESWRMSYASKAGSCQFSFTNKGASK